MSVADIGPLFLNSGTRGESGHKLTPKFTRRTFGNTENGQQTPRGGCLTTVAYKPSIVIEQATSSFLTLSGSLN